MSYLWNVLSMKWSIYEISVYEMTFYEMSFLWNDLSMKCPFYEMIYLWNLRLCNIYLWDIPTPILHSSTYHLNCTVGKFVAISLIRSRNQKQKQIKIFRDHFGRKIITIFISLIIAPRNNELKKRTKMFFIYNM